MLKSSQIWPLRTLSHWLLYLCDLPTSFFLKPFCNDTFCLNKVFQAHFPPALLFLEVNLSEKPWPLSAVTGWMVFSRPRSGHQTCLWLRGVSCSLNPSVNRARKYMQVCIQNARYQHLQCQSVPGGFFLDLPPSIWCLFLYSERLAPNDVKPFTVCSTLQCVFMKFQNYLINKELFAVPCPLPQILHLSLSCRYKVKFCVINYLGLSLFPFFSPFRIDMVFIWNIFVFQSHSFFFS